MPPGSGANPLKTRARCSADEKSERIRAEIAVIGWRSPLNRCCSFPAGRVTQLAHELLGASSMPLPFLGARRKVQTPARVAQSQLALLEVKEEELAVTRVGR